MLDSEKYDVLVSKVEEINAEITLINNKYRKLLIIKDVLEREIEYLEPCKNTDLPF